MQINEITKKVMSCVSRFTLCWDPGILESTYRKCLAHEMRQVGLKVVEEPKIRYFSWEKVVNFFWYAGFRSGNTGSRSEFSALQKS